MAEQCLQQLACRHIPKQDAAIGPGAGQALTIRAERHAANEVAVAVKDMTELASLGIPQHDPRFLAAAGQKPAVGAGGERPNRVLLRHQLSFLLAAGCIPHADFGIPTGAGQLLSARAERHADESGTGMAGQCEQFVDVRIPKPNYAIVAYAADSRPVRTHGEGGNSLFLVGPARCVRLGRPVSGAGPRGRRGVIHSRWRLTGARRCGGRDAARFAA